MNIDYITNFEINNSSGGWNGINNQLYNSLNNECKVKYYGPINPPIYFWEKVISKLLRILNGRGSYFFYSEKRLNKIAEKIDNLKLEGELLFYFGATPWLKARNIKPYVVYIDICFPKYLSIFLSDQKFSEKDIKRVSEKEKLFLSNAKHIFWGSEWALNDASLVYNTKFPRSTVVSTGGFIPLPEKINNTPKKKLLFISLNFSKKGGWIAFDVFVNLRRQFPELCFTIIGEKPPKEIIDCEGINYLGLLNKNNPQDLEVFISEFNSAFFLIHPTEMDTMGAVIAEAGYYGLPTIAANNFGIPDLIKNGKTGILIDLPLTESKFSNAISYYLDNNEEYLKLRRQVREYMLENRTWETISKIVINKIEN